MPDHPCQALADPDRQKSPSRQAQGLWAYVADDKINQTSFGLAKRSRCEYHKRSCIGGNVLPKADE
jgi:hypothetical protein